MKFIIDLPTSEDDAYKRFAEVIDKTFATGVPDRSLEPEYAAAKAILRMYQAINELEAIYPECVIREK